MIELSAEEAMVALAHVLSRAGARTTAVGGTIGFRIHGDEEGQAGGSWIVDLGVSGGAWSQPAEASEVERCNTTVYAFASAFPAIITKPDRVASLLDDGSFAVDGDKSKLILLGRILREGGSLLAQRVRSSRDLQKTKKRNVKAR
jgi:hypothetical protein